MTGTGICPNCSQPISDHDGDDRKRCHDALSGHRRLREDIAAAQAPRCPNETGCPSPRACGPMVWTGSRWYCPPCGAERPANLDGEGSAS